MKLSEVFIALEEGKTIKRTFLLDCYSYYRFIEIVPGKRLVARWNENEECEAEISSSICFPIGDTYEIA